ncbi:MAG TPA: TraR/DksA family transcriptional regulator [Candidatus Binataceae bacterium]|nr:TraR/DksA family transcriptional regulator [Candidatus Binataceae bacterium]
MPSRQTNDHQRKESLRAILTHERNEALARVREYRHDQEEEATPPPGDEMDVARSMADIETHASLIERVEDRLKAIDFAFDRLEHDRYGICAQCGEEIPLERLKALPFAAYCVDCQEKRNSAARTGKTWIDEPFIRQWDVPEEMAETTETSHDDFVALPSGEDDELAVPSAAPSPSEAKAAKKKSKARPGGKRAKR